MPEDLKNFVADDDPELYAAIVNALGWIAAAIGAGLALFGLAVILLSLS